MKKNDWKKHIGDRNSICIIVKVNSPKTGIISFDEDSVCYRMNVKAKPEKGLANIEIVKFFSRLLRKEIKVITGATSKKKILKIC